MATGRNSETLTDLKYDLLSYLSADHSEEDIKTLERMDAYEIAEMYQFEIHETEDKMEEAY